MKRTLVMLVVAVLIYGCTEKQNNLEYEKNCMIVGKLLWERAAIESIPDYDNV